MRKTSRPIPMVSVPMNLEPSVRFQVENYIRIMRRFRPLSETRKIELIHKRNTLRARQRLIRHYLPLVLDWAASVKGGDLIVKIEAGNRALMDWFQKNDCRPLDDVDYMVRSHVEEAFRAYC